MQRAYDQVVHDVAIQKLKVIFCLDRAGVAGADGPTHHGAYDIAYMRCIPNMIVSAPMNEEELRNLMFTAQHESNQLRKLKLTTTTTTKIQAYQPIKFIYFHKLKQML